MCSQIDVYVDGKVIDQFLECVTGMRTPPTFDSSATKIPTQGEEEAEVAPVDSVRGRGVGLLGIETINWTDTK